MPILGYDTAGAGSLGAGTVIYGTSYQAESEDGKIITFHCACSAVDPTDKGLKLAVCNCTQSPNHDPSSQNVVEQVLIDPAQVSDDLSAPGAGEDISADAWYYLCFKTETVNTKVKYDSGSGYFWNHAQATFEIPDPLPSGFGYGGAYALSIWVEYGSGNDLISVLTLGLADGEQIVTLPVA